MSNRTCPETFSASGTERSWGRAKSSSPSTRTTFPSKNLNRSLKHINNQYDMCHVYRDQSIVVTRASKLAFFEHQMTFGLLIWLALCFLSTVHCSHSSADPSKIRVYARDAEGKGDFYPILDDYATAWKDGVLEAPFAPHANGAFQMNTELLFIREKFLSGTSTTSFSAKYMDAVTARSSPESSPKAIFQSVRNHSHFSGFLIFRSLSKNFSLKFSSAPKRDQSSRTAFTCLMKIRRRARNLSC